MKRAVFTSDYDPDTRLSIIQTDDGDIILKIHGNGEMRIATSGGKLHGNNLVDICSSFSRIIDILKEEEKKNG